MKIFFFLLFFFCSIIFAKENNIQHLPFTPNTLKRVMEKNEIISICKVNSEKIKKKQNLDFRIIGLHSQSCDQALKKISQYENFSQYISSITSSNYHSETQRIELTVSAPLLKNSFILNFKIERITTAGTYPFLFDNGFLKGLTGNIHVTEQNQRCLFLLTAVWDGPDTGFNSTILEIFITTITRIGMEKLFKIYSLNPSPAATPNP